MDTGAEFTVITLETANRGNQLGGSLEEQMVISLTYNSEHISLYCQNGTRD